MHYAMFSTRSGKASAGCAAVLCLLTTVVMAAQEASHPAAEKSAMRMSIRSSGSTRNASETILREIDDPASGAKWLLMSDPEHPGGPGRMVLAGKRVSDGAGPAAKEALPIIHTGDRLIVEEHTRVMDAQLEAVAMGNARKGAPVQARLKVSGTVVNAIAEAPGRAVFGPELEMRP